MFETLNKRLNEGDATVDVTEKLSTSVETVTHCVQGLMYLLTESVRLTVSAVSKDHWKIY